jgi:hypothetical protein
VTPDEIRAGLRVEGRDPNPIRVTRVQLVAASDRAIVLDVFTDADCDPTAFVGRSGDGTGYSGATLYPDGDARGDTSISLPLPPPWHALALRMSERHARIVWTREDGAGMEWKP